MYGFGQQLTEDIHFLDHMECRIPVQVYGSGRHLEIGYVEGISRGFIKIGGFYFSRRLHQFLSRPGY